MFIWFIALSVSSVALIFRSSTLDFRIVVLGCLLPLIEGAFGGRWVLHTLMCNAILLLGVMALAQGRRLAQRRWLGLPIGTLSHLMLDGTWTDTSVFWWPFAGVEALGVEAVSEFERLPAGLLLEAAGLVVGLWAWSKFRLSDPVVRRALVMDGRLVAIGSS
ncbi:MAG: metal-dependent hydrolase [Actinomycetota bacterium]|nr:metal-dependent hydrolase [Actinomycetota bacterium]